MKKILIVIILLVITANAQQKQRDTIITTIAADTSLTSSINLFARDVSGYIASITITGADWTGTEITFQNSVDGINFYNVDLSDGSSLSIPAGAEKTILFAPYEIIYLGPFIKIRSGTADTPAVQSADQTIIIELRKL